MWFVKWDIVEIKDDWYKFTITEKKWGKYLYKTEWLTTRWTKWNNLKKSNVIRV